MSTSNTNVTNMEGGVGTSLMPRPSQCSVEGRFPVLPLALPIKLELLKGGSRQAGSQPFKVGTSGSDLSTENLCRVPLSLQGFLPMRTTGSEHTEGPPLDHSLEETRKRPLTAPWIKMRGGRLYMFNAH
eukprot:1258510-Amphidinium_carterae.1